jgi:hypothetical protein
MALRLLYHSTNSSGISVHARFNRHDPSMPVSGFEGLCVAMVALWLEKMLTAGVDSARPSSTGPRSPEFLQAKIYNYAASLPPAARRFTGDRILKEVGLLPGDVFDTLSMRNEPKMHRLGGYYINMQSHALGFVVTRPFRQPCHYYFFDPDSGVYLTTELDDFAAVEVIIRNTHGQMPHYNPLWTVTSAYPPDFI